ncbi:hypothetical protein NL676_037410 [Syzygium grande]|nr:hypothetical protein NL676_037410 [Syzygium grande]
MGACALGLAVYDLPDALGTPSREGCYMALLRIRHEYHVLRPHLGTIIEGVLDSTFASAYERKPARGSRYILDLVLRFRDNMEAGLRELVLTLYFSPSFLMRIGACALGLATEELRNGIDTASKERCYLAVIRMRQEYQLLRPHLGIIIELEHRIIHL